MAPRYSAQHDAHSDASPDRGITVAYATAAQGVELCNDPRVLALLRFGPRSWTDRERPQEFGVGLPLVDSTTDMVEVWRTGRPAHTLQTEDLVLRATDDCAFGHILIDEADHGGLETATHAAYERILHTLRAQGFAHLIRIWHYFPAINHIEHGIERYQAFCIGRHRALARQHGFERTLPAATAIGCHGSGLLIYFIAAKSPGIAVENPRQVSAYRYPRQYGPKSPSFSRAMLQSGSGNDTLYISGTASVVGHASRHRQDPAAQLDEAVRNLRAVMAQAGHGSDSKPQTLTALKVYLRDPDDLSRSAALLEERLGTRVPTIYLHGDICRTDLLVEIEAVCASDEPGGFRNTATATGTSGR